MIDQSMIFIKFQKEEYIKDLFAGKVYMNPLEYFVKKEFADGDKVVGDIYENCTVSDAYETPFGSPCSLILKNGYSKSYAYCLYGTHIDPDSGIKFEQKEKLKTFGDMALCIYNVDEFLRRVKRAALKEQHELFTDWIMYYDQKQPNTIEMMNNMIIHKTEAFFEAR